MDKDLVIAKLREHEDELRAAGVQTLSLFGSVARGEATEGSDVDVVVQLDLDVTGRGFSYFSSLSDLKEKLQDIVGKPVDIVSEPILKPRLAKEVARDRQLAF
ncbi:Putative nucleotidyltransferase [Neorhizobium galegae bv. officinalis bv. officinalis str. HAMBI 1141]|uniref:Putative nucleotidyltransferase n=1 Tax=Neorhizobium galegae bv. officinalis bv. officinalis str. HAMBI 1141 TaxID=1028801 RepID=A0A068T4F8_NEOGA|nr:nucleotidyltransferase [Neorhizobium galegae]CDN52916.1 Putative nucleotidyltransferase [Neorhizobium galegae bv. officinalis bv. officinalis str. HAMBI 1141]